MDGCRLVIRIKENEDDFTDSSKISSDNNEEGKDIIADTDCTIVDIITRTGTPMVQRGTKVKKGAILVSGQIPICNDEKEITGYRLKNADADITGEKAITYQKELTRQYIQKKYYRSRFYFLQKRNYGIRLGRHYFTTESKNNQYPVFEKHVVQKKYQIANVIPVTLEKSTITPYRQMYKKYTKADAIMILSADFEDYCNVLEKKGVEIIQNDVKIYTGSETYYAKGTLKIRCSVGRKMPSVPIPIENSSEEETKNGEAFSKELASLCDVFVNDAFGTAHRAHCSNVGVTKYVDTAVVGYLMQKEIDFLGNAVNNPVRPFVAILGGAKVADKLNVINNLLEKCDTLIIGGGMAYTFVKAQGGNVGISIVDDRKLDYCNDMLKQAEELVKKISRFRSYFEKSGGGVTFSGGDPLKQPEFLKETLKLC